MNENTLDSENFVKRLRIAQKRLHKLKRQATLSTNTPLHSHETLVDLEAALEELRLAEEELSVQNNQLVIAQDQLARERQRYEDLFALAPGNYIVTDTKGVILEANRAATMLLHRSAARLYGKPLVVFIPRHAQTTFYAHLSQATQTRSIQKWETQLRLYRTAPIEVAIELGAIEAKDELQTLSWLIRDITEEKCAQEQIHTLSRKLMQAIETERLAISRELHDDFGQVLTSLKMKLQTIAHTAAVPEYRDVIELVDYLASKVRSVALDLRPSMLDDLGLFPALAWYFTRYTQQTGIQVHFIRPEREQRLNSDADIAAYRIVQEALTNVARYAQVKEATVRVWYNAQRLYLQVADEGKGFDLAQVQVNVVSSGLVGMKERIALLGGELEIDAAPDSGTCITAKIPLVAMFGQPIL